MGGAHELKQRGKPDRAGAGAKGCEGGAENQPISVELVDDCGGDSAAQ